jgi:hypothetical protein
LDKSLPVLNLKNLLIKEEINSTDIFERFSWVDNDSFLISSTCGFEKLYKINNLNKLEDINSS